jgi:RHS repeat-associated protein
VTPGAYDTTLNGTKDDAFIVKIGEAAPPPSSWTTTYTYTYDPLYRLAGATYSSGEFFEYTYDAAGNRLSETTHLGTTTYTHDDANRLADVNGVTYTWDDNSNLLSDGVNAYTYDHANRLTSVVGPSSSSSYAYNGLGDRLRQTVDGVTTDYTLDLNNWLTQVLADGTNTYLYGAGRIVQYDASGAEYFLGDALGSVRQLADSTGEVGMSKIYEPFGEVLDDTGSVTSSYGFTGEWADSTGLLHLRARYYSPYLNQFIQPDPILPDPYVPADWNRYIYARNNPANLMDPSGKFPECDRYQRADLTQWLIDEMNQNRKGYVFYVMWIALHFPNLLDTIIPDAPIDLIPDELISYGVAYGLFADVVKPHGLWDFKWRIQRIVGNNIQLTNNWYTNEVPGDVYFGFIGLAAGFDKYILHCGADFATNGKLCSGSDPTEDYEAIEAGYDIYKQSGWGSVTEDMLEIALAKHPLIAAGREKEPKPKVYEIPWPYPIGTFDDGSSGWIIKHR